MFSDKRRIGEPSPYLVCQWVSQPTQDDAVVRFADWLTTQVVEREVEYGGSGSVKIALCGHRYAALCLEFSYKSPLGLMDGGCYASAVWADYSSRIPFCKFTRHEISPPTRCGRESWLALALTLRYVFSPMRITSGKPKAAVPFMDLPLPSFLPVPRTPPHRSQR